MRSSPSLISRACFGVLRGLLVIVALLLGVIVGGVAIIPFTIFVLPLPLILGGLLVLYVLAATQGMADDWHARRGRRRRPPAKAARQRSADASRGPTRIHDVATVPGATKGRAWTPRRSR
jgi:hypothetical protein